MKNATRRTTVSLGLSLVVLVTLAGCNLFGPAAIFDTTTVGVSVGTSTGPSGGIVPGGSVAPTPGGPSQAIGSSTSPDEISTVVLSIAGQDRFGIYQDPLATLTLSGAGASWSGSVPGLPLGPALTFTVQAFDSSGTLIYTATTTTVLSALQLTVALVLLPYDDAVTVVGFPVIRQISRPAEIVEGTAAAVSVDLEGSSDETLTVEIISGGGTLAPANPIAVPLAGGAATLDLIYAAPDDAPATYLHTIRAENEQGNAVSRDFTTTVVWDTEDAGISIGGVAPAVVGLELGLDAAGDLEIGAVVTDDGPLSEISFEWSYDGALSFADSTANPAVLLGYDETATGMVTLTVTDSDTSILAGGLATTVTFLLPAGLFPDVVESAPGGGAAPVWNITDLGEGYSPSDVGNGGHVVGHRVPPEGGYQAFRWHGGAMTILGVIDLGTSSFAAGVNVHGDVAGYGSVGGSGGALLWPAGSSSPLNLGDLPGGIVNADARAVNDSGEVAGASFAAEGRRAFHWDGVTMASIGALPSASSFESNGADINNPGQVVGYSRVSNAAYHAFFWDPATGIQDLGVLPRPGHTISYGRAVNDAGVVVGESHNNSDESVPYRWTTTEGMQDLGDLPGYGWSAASDINATELVVGGAWNTTFDDSRAWFWVPGGAIEDMNLHLDSASSGWTLRWASAVNDAGWVVGTGINPAGIEVGFLAVPQ